MTRKEAYAGFVLRHVCVKTLMTRAVLSTTWAQSGTDPEARITQRRYNELSKSVFGGKETRQREVTWLETVSGAMIRPVARDTSWNLEAFIRQ